MKKLIMLVVVMMAGVLACSSCKKSTPPSDNLTCNEASCPLPEAGSNRAVFDFISEDNWQFALSGANWVPVQSPDDTIKVVFLNRELGTVVFLGKEPTQQTFTDYITVSLRTFQSAGVNIQSAKQVDINGTHYVAITAQGNERLFWAWITVQQGAGYLFTCAVDHMDAGTDDQQRCQDIASTLHIQ